MNNIKVNITPSPLDIQTLHCSKGDTDEREFRFSLHNNGENVDISDITGGFVPYPVYEGGTEQLLPVNTDTPTTSYFDGTINYGTDTDVEFTYKQSSYTGKARVKSIKGNTLVWNQQCSNFGVSRATISSNTNSTSNITCTSTQTGTSFGMVFKNPSGNYQFIANHVYFVSVNMADFSVGSLRGFGVETGLNPSSDFITTKGRYVALCYPTSTAARSFLCFTNGTPLSTDTFTFNSVLVTDLTQMYESGNEPSTLEEFTSLFPLLFYAYDSGSLLNFNGTGIKTENKDQTDEYTLSLPISTYFPTGMKDVPDNTNGGKIYDELSDKAITRVGSYTITSFDAKGGSTAVNTYRITGLRSLIKKPSANTVMANIVGDKFPTAIYNEVYSGRQSGISVNSSGDVFVDLSYSTLEDANTWVATNPITLNYELATYTETDIKTASLVCKNTEVPCYISNGELVCDATEELTNESGFFDAKIQIKDSNSTIYSSKIQLHVEGL